MIIKTFGATILVTRDKRHYKGSGDPYFHSGPQKVDQMVIGKVDRCLQLLWVYGHYKDVYSYSAGSDFSRQILTTKVGPRTVRVKAPSFRTSILLMIVLTMETQYYDYATSFYYFFYFFI